MPLVPSGDFQPATYANMCGIAGIAAPKRPEWLQQQIESMTRCLAHRGPDAQGTFISPPIALGHRRLSIIDTSTGANQPMTNEDGTVQLVFNGEIYNFLELKASLARKGHVFRTHSDTETIVHAWEEYGVECLKHFNGMFAFALYDSRQRLIFLARDRLGKKPLHYLEVEGIFAFASEIKALLKLSGCPKEIDPHAVAEFWHYGYISSPRSIYKSIRKLPGAHYATVRLQEGEAAGTISIHRYWHPEPDGSSARPEPSLEEFEELVVDAVRLRQRSDVPLGAFLSGGIDSSLVTALAQENLDLPLRTFTIGFRETFQDESPYARQVAALAGTMHHCETIDASIHDLLRDLPDCYDEPFGDSSALPTMLLCRATAGHVKVALSGDGGDEVFFGYKRYFQCRLLNGAASVLGKPGRGLAQTAARLVPDGIFARKSLERISLLNFDLYHHAMGYRATKLRCLTPEPKGGVPSLRQAYPSTSSLDLVSRYAVADLLHYLPECVLTKVDRASMKFGLEVRCPLLDYRVVEFALRQPTRWKANAFKGKLPLRMLLASRLPSSLFERSKRGFGIPLKHWLRGVLRPEMEEVRSTPGHPMWEYFSYPQCAELIRAHLEGRRDFSEEAWRLLVFWKWQNSQSETHA
jgi:asparagine synthase (glutamine-hydrolysing)